MQMTAIYIEWPLSRASILKVYWGGRNIFLVILYINIRVSINVNTQRPE